MNFLKPLSFLFLFFNVIFYSFSNFTLKDVKIEGFRSLNKEFLMSNLFPYEIGESINDAKVDIIIKELYKSGYFDEISINQDKKNGILNIKLIENFVINDVKFEGLDKFSKKDIEPFLETKAGEMYSKYKLKSDIVKLSITYEQFGYFDIEIKAYIKIIEDEKVDIIFDIKEKEAYLVEDINFNGNQNLKRGDLIDNIEIKGKKRFNPISHGDDFNEQKLEQDKLNLIKKYKNEGFLEVELNSVNTSVDLYNKRIFLDIILKEGEKFYLNQITLNSDNINLKEEVLNKIKSLITLKKDDLYSNADIDSIKNEILEYLSEEGYPTAAIEIKEKKVSKNRVDIEFAILKSHPIKIRKIEIKGNQSTRDYVIRRELLIKEGDLYQKNKVDVSKDRLTFLGYFKKVDFKEKQINENEIDLDIIVEEQFFGNINFSIGYSTFEGIIGSVNLQLMNILGTGYTLNLGLTRSGFQESYSVGLFNPRVLNSDVGFGLDIFFSRFGKIDFLGFGSSSFISNYLAFQSISFGGNGRFSFRLAERLYYNVGFGYNYYYMSSLRDIGFELYTLQYGARQSFKLNHSLTYDKRNYARYATSGYFATIFQEYAGFGVLGNQDYIKTELSGGLLIPFFDDNIIFSVNLNFGFTQHSFGNRGAMLSYDALYTMGYYDVRGFSFFGVGPRIESTAANGTVSIMPYALPARNRFYGTVDLASPLFIPKEYGIKFSVWCDFGTIWGSELPSYYLASNGSVERVIGDNPFMRVSVGAGIVWQSPMGEIRFDFAQPIVKMPYDIPMTFVVRMGSKF